MSSIYRKGRDGYYYYQTYVHNPETGKKNKRIFHSLGTKDKTEAEGKQIELDTQYEIAGQERTKPSSNIVHSQNFKTIVIISITILLTLIVVDLLDENSKNKQKNKSHPVLQDIIKEKSLPITIIDSKEEAGSGISKSTAAKNAKPEIQKQTLIKSKPVKPKSVTPKHTVIRTESLSGAFDQGKVFATVNQKASTESLRLLCHKLKKRYSEYSNIVICLYADSKMGKEMAGGNAQSLSAEDKKKAWLAMFSYNSVEGEYFDDNPGGYLGAY